MSNPSSLVTFVNYCLPAPIEVLAVVQAIFNEVSKAMLKSVTAF